MPPVSAEEKSDKARAVTQRGADSCTDTLNKAMVRILAPPATSSARQVSGTWRLTPTSASAMPLTSASTAVVRCVPKRSRHGPTNSAPSTAPTPLAPSNRP